MNLCNRVINYEITFQMNCNNNTIWVQSTTYSQKALHRGTAVWHHYHLAPDWMPQTQERVLMCTAAALGIALHPRSFHQCKTLINGYTVTVMGVDDLTLPFFLKVAVFKQSLKHSVTGFTPHQTLDSINSHQYLLCSRPQWLIALLWIFPAPFVYRCNLIHALEVICLHLAKSFPHRVIPKRSSLK